jgi:Cu(I)/Ag(I) efflux system membrane fusion protein
MKKIYISLLFAIITNTFIWSHGNSHQLKPKDVDILVTPYLDIQIALAADNFEDAQKASSTLLDKLKSDDLSMHSSKTMQDIKISSEEIKDAKTIKEARIEFQILSAGIKNLAEIIGTSGTQPLFIAYCPMAFNNTGGEWLQGDNTLANPYYGAMMLRCGSIKGAVKKIKKASINDLKPASAELIASQGKNYPMTCMVSDEPLIEGEILDYQYNGKLVRFCCKGCRKDFVKNPEMYLEKLEKLKKGNGHNHSHKSEHDHSKHHH